MTLDAAAAVLLYDGGAGLDEDAMYNPSAGGLDFFFGLDNDDMLWNEEVKLERREK